jgi:hypothetical protein
MYPVDNKGCYRDPPQHRPAAVVVAVAAVAAAYSKFPFPRSQQDQK